MNVSRVLIGDARRILKGEFPVQLNEVEVCYYLGSNPATHSALQKKLIPLQGCWKSIGEYLDKVSQDFRTPFIEFIGRLSAKNNSPQWWSTELPNKNPFPSPLFFQSCLVKVACLIAVDNKSTILFVVDEPVLLKTLQLNIGKSKVIHSYSKGIRNIIKRLVFWKLISIAKRSIGFLWYLRRKNQISQSLKWVTLFQDDRANVLVFTWLDRRNFTESGEYRDPHWGQVISFLKKHGFSVIIVPRILSSIDISEALHLINNAEEKILLMETILSPFDVFSVFVKTLLKKFSLANEMKIDQISIEPLVLNSVLQEEQHLSSYQNLLYYFLVKKLAQRNIALQNVLITMEGHSWERVLSCGLRTFLPDAKLVAFDNMSLSRMLLSMYPSKAEFGFMPIPNRIVTHGPAALKRLVDNGYPSEMVVDGGYIRDESLWKMGKKSVRNPKSDVCHVVVTPSIGLGDSLELVQKVLRAFRGDPTFQITIKCHPVVSTNELIEGLGELWPQPNAGFTDRDISCLLESAHVLIYTYTTVCFDALIQGVPPVFVKSDYRLNLNKLDTAPQCYWIASNSQEIRQIVEEIFHLPDSEWGIWYEQALEVAQAYLSAVNEEKLTQFLL